MPEAASPRVAIASLMQETNTFSPVATTREVFETYYVLHGDELLTGYGAARVEVPAFLGIGAIRLLVRSNPSMEWATAMFLSQGLDPHAAALVFVKSPSHFRPSFGPLAARILLADTPGPTCADMRRIPFRHVTRPLYPLDEF